MKMHFRKRSIIVVVKITFCYIDIVVKLFVSNSAFRLRICHFISSIKSDTYLSPSLLWVVHCMEGSLVYKWFKIECDISFFILLTVYIYNVKNGILPSNSFILSLF